MNKYLNWSRYSMYFAGGLLASMIFSYYIIPNVNIEILLVYALISTFGIITAWILLAIGTEVKPKDEEDEAIRKAVNWPL